MEAFSVCDVAKITDVCPCLTVVDCLLLSILSVAVMAMAMQSYSLINIAVKATSAFQPIGAIK